MIDGAKRYRRIEKIVVAVPMTEYDFLMADEKHYINGARKVGYRPGYKVTDGKSMSWVSADDFKKEYVEVAETADE